MKRCGTRCMAVVVAGVSLAVYLTTIVPTVGWTDTGELMAVAHTFGTAHPTGYPLMTVVARLWLQIPTAWRVVEQLNVLSAVLTAAAVGLFWTAMRRMFMEIRKQDIRTHVLPTLAGAAALATSLTFWTQSSSYEVYALHLLLTSLVLSSYSLAVAEQKLDPSRASRWWFAFAYVVGLGFANHMTTVLLGPALLWDFVRRFGRDRGAWWRVGYMAIPAFAALTMYLVLPVRASAWPSLNWGNPSTWENFWWHILGAQYRVWMFNGTEVMSKQWSYFVGSVGGEFVWPWLVIAGWGWFVAWKRWRRIAEFLTVLSVTGILYAINYDIHEIGPYFLTVYVAISYAIVPGLVDLYERAGALSRFGSVAVTVSVVALVVWQINDHHPRISKANPAFIEEFARQELAGASPNAVLMTGRWDYLYSPMLYLQHVERVRTDVLVIDHSLLRDRSWYVESLRRRSPWLDSALAEEFIGFLRELRKFERGEAFVPAVIQMRWDALLSGILRVSQESRQVYLDVRLAAELRLGMLQPDGHLVRLRTVDGVGGGRPPIRIPVDGNESAYLSDFREYLASSFLQHAYSARQTGNSVVADSFAAIAARYAPGHPWLTAFSPFDKKLRE